MSEYTNLDPETVRAIRELADAPVPLEELRARWARELPAEELAENIDLIEWFCRRYPTPEARLRYARRAFRRWAAAMPKDR
jgi:hypothetical protein